MDKLEFRELQVVSKYLSDIKENKTPTEPLKSTKTDSSSPSIPPQDPSLTKPENDLISQTLSVYDKVLFKSMFPKLVLLPITSLLALYFQIQFFKRKGFRFHSFLTTVISAIFVLAICAHCPIAILGFSKKNVSFISKIFS